MVITKLPLLAVLSINFCDIITLGKLHIYPSLISVLHMLNFVLDDVAVWKWIHMHSVCLLGKCDYGFVSFIVSRIWCRSEYTDTGIAVYLKYRDTEKHWKVVRVAM
jgi:hypothetical protein